MLENDKRWHQNAKKDIRIRKHEREIDFAILAQPHHVHNMNKVDQLSMVPFIESLCPNACKYNHTCAPKLNDLVSFYFCCGTKNHSV